VPVGSALSVLFWLADEHPEPVVVVGAAQRWLASACVYHEGATGCYTVPHCYTGRQTPVLHDAHVIRLPTSDAPDRAGRYPWHALERTTRRQIDVFRGVRRWLTTHVDLSRVSAALGELLRGARIQLYLQNARILKGPRAIPGGVAVLVAPADAPDLGSSLLVEMEFALVATALLRMNDTVPRAALAPKDTIAPHIANAASTIVMTALRRAHQGKSMRMVSAGPASALETDMVKLGQELAALTFTVVMDTEAFELRLIMPTSAMSCIAGPSWNEGALATLGVTPLSLPIVAETLQSTTSEVASLRDGDALLLDWPLKRNQQGVWHGPALLTSPDGELGIAIDLLPDGSAVLRGDISSMGVVQKETETDMNDGKEQLVQNIGDIPVVLRVEVGAARMAAREWAAMTVGDVIGLGQPIGQSVILRVGGVAIARGDLVEIEGEVGVRIVERLDRDTAVE